MPKKGMYPFSSPKAKPGSSVARGVQGENGRSKGMHAVAAPSKGAKPIAAKLAEAKANPGSLAKGPANLSTRAGNDKVSKPQRARPI